MRLGGFFASVVGFFRRHFARPFLLPIIQPPASTSPTTLVSTFLINSSNPMHYSMTDGIVRSDRNIPLEEALKLAPQDPIWANRGKAIQSYAILEQSLCSLLADLSEMKHHTATTIFYKITNSDSRNKILEQLLHAKHGRKYNLFWNAYFKDLRKIDLKRNEIVHWLSAMNAGFNTQNMMIIGITLIHPASLGRNAPPTQILSSDLLEFIAKCDVFALCNMFITATSHKEMGDAAKPWLDIFQRPLVYPLPAGHPLLNQTPAKPETPPQPSQA
jgi:hypothetical protein